MGLFVVGKSVQVVILFIFLVPWCSDVFVNSSKISTTTASSSLHVGAFNIQVFGKTKMSKPEIVDVLLKTVSRYDLMLFMEIRDISEKAIYEFLDQLNLKVGANEKFGLVLSERLGRTSSKEQYAYLYKVNKLKFVSSYQYPESKNLFERPPFAARFSVANSTNIKELALLGIHTTPSDVLNELNHLYDVQNLLKSYWKIDEMLLMGDFNADCTYISWRQFRELKLQSDKSMEWLIGPCHMTTMVSTKCLYDHIVVSGKKLQNAVQSGSAQVYFFDEVLGLNETMAGWVSDHFPVEFKLALTTFENNQVIKMKQQIMVKQWRSIVALLGNAKDGNDMLDQEWEIATEENSINFVKSIFSSELFAVLSSFNITTKGLISMETVNELRLQSAKSLLPEIKAKLTISCGLKFMDYCNIEISN